LRFELAGRDFDEIAAVRIAVLAHQQHPAIVQGRHDSDRAGVADVLAHGLAAVRQPHPVPMHMQEPAGIDFFAGEQVLGEILPLQGATGS